MNPNSLIYHIGGFSSKSVKPEMLYHGYAGGIYFAYKHYGIGLAKLYQIILYLDLIFRLCWNFSGSVFIKSKVDYTKTFFRLIILNTKWLLFKFRV